MYYFKINDIVINEKDQCINQISTFSYSMGNIKIKKFEYFRKISKFKYIHNKSNDAEYMIHDTFNAIYVDTFEMKSRFFYVLFNIMKNLPIESKLKLLNKNIPMIKEE
jgi:hypothetical protein